MATLFKMQILAGQDWDMWAPRLAPLQNELFENLFNISAVQRTSDILHWYFSAPCKLAPRVAARLACPLIRLSIWVTRTLGSLVQFTLEIRVGVRLSVLRS
jgi:hypothetical protein